MDTEHAEQTKQVPVSSMDSSKLITNTAANIVSRGLQILLLLLVTRILMDTLKKEGFGLFALAGAITGYFTFLSFGIHGAILKYVPHYQARNDEANLSRVISCSFAFLVGVGLLSCLALVCLARWGVGILNIAPDNIPTARRILYFAAAVSLFSWPMSIFKSVLEGSQQYVTVAIIHNFKGIISYLVAINLALRGYSAEYVFLGYAIASCVEWFYCFRSCRRFLGGKILISLSSLDTAGFKELMTFSVWVFVVQIASLVIYQTDQIVLGVFVTVGAIGIYQVVSAPHYLIRELIILLNSAIVPFVSEKHSLKDNSTIRELLMRGTRLQVTVVLPVLISLIVMMPEILVIWMGDELYRQYSLVARVFLSYLAVTVIGGMSFMILYGLGEVRIIALISAGSAALNLIISVILAKMLGLMGVVLGTVIASCLFSPLGLLVYARKFKISLRQTIFRVAWRSYLYVVLGGLVFHLIWQSWATVERTGFTIALGILLTAVFCLGAIFTCIPGKERIFIFKRLIKGQKTQEHVSS